MQKSKQQYKDQSNSVFAFISNYLEKTEEDCRVMLKNTYELYVDFCNAEGERDVLTKTEFQGILRSFGSKEFVSENYQRFKHLFFSKHEKKPKPIKGPEGMYSLKRLSEII